MFSISSYKENCWNEIWLVKQAGKYCELTLKKKRRFEESWRRVFQVFHHIEWTKKSLCMHLVHKYLPEILRSHGVLPWCIGTSIVIFWACFLATLHWCNSCRNWWELRNYIWKVKVLDRAVCTKNRKEPKITQCRKHAKNCIFSWFPARFKCLLTVCS